jgi:hypothetical protein
MHATLRWVRRLDDGPGGVDGLGIFYLHVWRVFLWYGTPR